MRCCARSSSTTWVATRSRKSRSWLATSTGSLVAGHEVGHQLEAGGIEVVGRLVEQQHLVAAEQHGRERRPRGLAARETPERAVRLGVEPELPGDLLQPVLEVGAAEREPVLER